VSDESDLVRRGYDRLAERFGAWRESITGSPEVEWVAELLSSAPQGAVLELGCGQGVIGAYVLGAGRAYTGVDLSAEQLQRAGKRLPTATLVQDNMKTVTFGPASFAAVISVYAFNHIPRGRLPVLLERIGRWLQPGGHLLVTFGTSGVEGMERDWLGVPMFFSGSTPAENLGLVSAAGLDVVREEVVAIEEPEGEARFHWVLART
jgi:cyclopropane fatty-acyl-phospholipid synthase-like methyltransferase